MKKLSLVLVFVMGMFASCSEAKQGHGSSLDSIEDVVDGDTDNDTDDTLIIVPWEEEEPEPDPECIVCEMYFCPPLDEIWRKEICMNTCDDPPTLYSESECFQYME